MSQEGGGGSKDHGYQRVTVKCITYDGRVIEADTLVNHKSTQMEGYWPSKRYLDLMINGKN